MGIVMTLTMTFTIQFDNRKIGPQQIEDRILDALHVDVVDAISSQKA